MSMLQELKSLTQRRRAAKKPKAFPSFFLQKAACFLQKSCVFPPLRLGVQFFDLFAYHLKKKGKRPEGFFKNLVEPLKPSGRCFALPKLLGRYLFAMELLMGYKPLPGLTSPFKQARMNLELYLLPKSEVVCKK